MLVESRMRATCMSGFRGRERGDGTEAAQLACLFSTRHLPMSRGQAKLFFQVAFRAVTFATRMSRSENSVSPAARQGLVRSCFPVSAPNNHALAILQSRLTVSGEIPRSSAVSSTLNPPK